MTTLPLINRRFVLEKRRKTATSVATADQHRPHRACGHLRNATPEPLTNWFQLHINQATMKLSFSWTTLTGSMRRMPIAWIEGEQGGLQYRKHIADGLENAPDAPRKLFDSTNRGKLILKIKLDAS